MANLETSMSMVKMQLRTALSNFTTHVLYLNFVDMDNSPYMVVHVNTTYLLLEKAYQMWLKSLERVEACCVDQIRVLSSVKVEPYAYCDLITDYYANKFSSTQSNVCHF